jgi:hypothetical protein
MVPVPTLQQQPVKELTGVRSMQKAGQGMTARETEQIASGLYLVR